MGKTFTLTSNSKGIYGKLVLTEQSQSIDNNSTVLLWQFYMWNTTGSWYSYSSKNVIRISINGGYVYNTDNYGTVSLQGGQSESSAKLMCSGTTTIYHNNDGGKTIPVSFYAAQAHQSPPLYEWSASQNCDLTQIARASQPSIITWPNTTPNIGYLGDTVTIHCNRVSTNFRHIVRYNFNGASGLIANDVADSCQWTIPLELANQIPNVANGDGTVQLDTYLNGVLIGIKYVSFTVRIPASMAPDVGISITEATDGIADKFGFFVKGRSTLKVDINATAKYNATIKNISSVINDDTYTSASFTTNALKYAGDKQLLKVNVMDSRGMGRYVPTQYNVVDYTAPTVSSFYAIRCNEDGVANDNGAYTKIAFSGNITALNNKNDKACKLAYKKTSESSWSEITIPVDSYSISAEKIIPTDADYAYNIKVVLTDFFQSTERYYDLGTGYALINLKGNGKGIAFGKVSEYDGLDIGMNLYLNGNPFFMKTITGTFTPTLPNATTYYSFAYEIGITGNQCTCRLVCQVNKMGTYADTDSSDEVSIDLPVVFSDTSDWIAPLIPSGVEELSVVKKLKIVPGTGTLTCMKQYNSPVKWSDIGDGSWLFYTNFTTTIKEA